MTSTGEATRLYKKARRSIQIKAILTLYKAYGNYSKADETP